MAIRLENTQIQRAGWKQIGHFGSGTLELVFNGGRVQIHPCGAIDDLFGKVFGIDTENGVWFESLAGRYCRLMVDESNRIVGLKHIVNEGWVNVNDLDRPREEKK